MDAVYLCGGVGRANGDPLRYSIRTVLAHMPQVTGVVTVGHRWPWLAPDLHLDVPPMSKHWHTYTNVRAAIADERVSDQFILMNDDFFVLEPVAEMPVWHRGPVTDRIADHQRTGNNTMLRRRRLAVYMLAALGVDEPLDYELHVPLPMDKTLAAKAYDAADQVRPGDEDPTGKRTLYGNLASIGGRLAQDVKVTSGRVGLPQGPFLSTASASWPGKVGVEVRRRFRAPSPYERR